MVRMDYRVSLQYESNGRSDFVLNICPARTRAQCVFNESFVAEGATPSSTFTDPITANRINRLTTGGGPVLVRYAGSIELDHVINDPATLEERTIRSMPSEVLPYIFPSRYCQSDKMRTLAMSMFGKVAPGYARVVSICEWVTQHVRFNPNASNATTCAIDTFDSRAGVCRDYAHLMISMCRALNIPARYVTGVDYGADPAFGPTDFHAYVEVFLGRCWYLFDPSGMTPVMGLIRIGTGRDAADVSFATLFGNVRCLRPQLAIDLVSCDETNFEPAASRQKAVSTASDNLYFDAGQRKNTAHQQQEFPVGVSIPGPWTIPESSNTVHPARFA